MASTLEVISLKGRRLHSNRFLHGYDMRNQTTGLVKVVIIH